MITATHGAEIWEDAPLATLLSHIEDGQSAQKRDLDWLRERIQPLLDEDSGTTLPVHTLSALVASLEQTSTIHRGTTRHLSARLVNLADPGRDPLAVPDRGLLARLLRRIRDEHENVLGLLDFAQRITANFACSASADKPYRDLYRALAVWNERERARIRVEFEHLVSRTLALDPALSHDAHAVSLTVHSREVLAKGGCREQRTVFCPAERESVGVEWCRGCPLVRRVGPDAVKCTPHVEPIPHGPAVRLGEHTLVGEAMVRHLVSALPDVSASELAQALASESGRPALVVDDGDRLLGIIDLVASELSPDGRRAADLLHAAASISESASLADAVQSMTKSRARFLPVIGKDGRVVGLLADVDVLRWIARHRERA